MSQPEGLDVETDAAPVHLFLPPVPLPVLSQIKSLCFTGYHKHNGLLGLIFPSLECLKASTVIVLLFYYLLLLISEI
jgi:hypothetical protein